VKGFSEWPVCRGGFYSVLISPAMRRNIIPYSPKLKSLARALRKNMTYSEVLLWNELKQKKMMGYDFDRQRPMDNYIVDFYCKDLMLAIEIDGESHQYTDVAENDIIRQQRLESLGVTVIRLDDLDVKQDIDAVLHFIEERIYTLTKKKSM
jgi:very-short-patch-repair endonuclease